jgi:hypothetical protein
MISIPEEATGGEQGALHLDRHALVVVALDALDLLRRAEDDADA